jgi:hypothetical protein
MKMDILIPGPHVTVKVYSSNIKKNILEKYAKDLRIILDWSFLGFVWQNPFLLKKQSIQNKSKGVFAKQLLH